MPSLKDLRNRISSVKSTKKITSAMKMVAASRLRRAQDAAEASRPFAERMNRMLGTLAGSVVGLPGAPRLLAGTGQNRVHLIVVVTSNRGLCGGLNSSTARNTRMLIRELQEDGKEVKVLCVGRKGRDQLKRDHNALILDTIEDFGRRGVTYEEAEAVSEKVLDMFEAGEFDVCTVVYNRFRSAISQIVTRQQLIPFPVPKTANENELAAEDGNPGAVYEFEPSEEGILDELLPLNVKTQIFRAMTENYASEQGARMTAMDNASRNAGEMIDDLTLEYNRARQAMITKELIEIISGAEAL
ncbi:F0F1 ATP synthase subunit gamma [Roseospira marina]|uniref:ATP synthase gamma chain n=1 Tax=Roseospira marina TaxID=140057 RepID=A0A5M6I986_9PROT|nr:F0F1 ATP synthase subunit gamma [Roseospira marina]KAA5604743.1 F0F1 ATP synthase subunit gamma [Roseospira marina]MBB4313418.1 F-type H+-transporting ATPase subunit gamma [Roseospira marina]MBB5086580.1 F-type H+-transporting ATPase subunit gamma [Roseospira marina]